MRKWLFASILLCACQTKAIATPLQGEWVNESGSLMIVSVNDQTGQLSGRYCSELGRVDPDSCHPLTGWITGDVVGFSVRFDPPGSVTTWSGQISQDSTGPYLRTLWNLSRDVPEAEEDDRLWESVISGYAVFRPKGALTPDLETREAE
jgi:hypothetical protein